MNIHVYSSEGQATHAATQWLTAKLLEPTTRNIMVAGGNTPLGIYAKIAAQNLSWDHLNVFALDEYVGVPRDEPRNCANLIRAAVIDAWKIPPSQYHPVSSSQGEAGRSITEHEQAIRAAGGLDLVILGLGRNGHLGFNEPGSTRRCGRCASSPSLLI